MLMRFDTSNLFLFGTNICALQNRTAKKKREGEREREGGGEGREEKRKKNRRRFLRLDRSARRGSEIARSATARVWPRKLPPPRADV